MHGNTASWEYGREPKISVLRSEGNNRGRRGCKMESRMCRFVRDGEPDIGEYRELADGTGICVLADMNGDSEEVVVSLPDGTMPENISDLELLKVPTTMHNHAWAGIRATDAGGSRRENGKDRFHHRGIQNRDTGRARGRGRAVPSPVPQRTLIKGNNDCGPHRFPGAGHNQPIINQPIINQPIINQPIINQC